MYVPIYSSFAYDYVGYDYDVPGVSYSYSFSPIAYVPSGADFAVDAEVVARQPSVIDTSGVSFTTWTPGLDAVIDEGIAAFSAGRTGEARQAFARAVIRDPSDPYARILYGLTWFADGDYALAFEAFHAALTYAPDVIAHPLDIRPLYSDPGVPEGQIAALVGTLRAEPERRDARFVLGYVLFLVERPGEAWDTLAPLTVERSDDEVLRGLAEVLRSMLNVDERGAPDVSPGPDPDPATAPPAGNGLPAPDAPAPFDGSIDE